VRMLLWAEVSGEDENGSISTRVKKT
jgi:hypothetical protein